ncbi:MAG: hypothetical protein ACI8TP_000323 [Acidimicrobiales bacterium]|jgi:hypothetical protein
MSINRLGLSQTDIAVMADALGDSPAAVTLRLEERPWSFLDLLEHPDIVQKVLEPATPLQSDASPHLYFAVLTQKAAADLRHTSVVNDWAGVGQRLPVFDVDPLREFIEAPGRVVFVASLLTRFCHIPDLPAPVSALDMEGLADWLEMAEPDDRVTLLCHLGDLALFSSGVMADQTGPRPFGPLTAERLGRTLDLNSGEILRLVDPASFSPGIDAMESLGPSWYRAATDQDANGRLSLVVNDIASRFRSARRFLNHLADCYLNPLEPDLGIIL